VQEYASVAAPTLAQVYEERAADFTRTAEQTDDPVFRNLLLTLAFQWRLAAREEASKHSTQPKTADGVLIPVPLDQNPCAHWRSPMDMMRQG